ncbi:hypothetical protein CALVIDRAFT_560960 [Calocera viscosa TUFC12733]|uniref:Mediator of RNA polymerase II transcription subunit 21 n=1 Tax=Calocera viscosa (strain TUFC12733) TaxID=1330018 RepID=A0A167QC00_CALVF|nr:hypothetical protein CALVIDRAFT_560960 [Calocera viscosa TUFC12733]
MDRITQLHDAIDRLLTIMQHSVYYLTERTDFLPFRPDVPVTQKYERADPKEEFEANQKELAEDLIEQAKKIEELIDSLPVDMDEDGQLERFEELQEELVAVNEEYVTVLAEARQLRDEINETLERVLKSVEAPEEPAANG